KFLCAFGDGAAKGGLDALGEHGVMLLAHGYKGFANLFDGGTCVATILAASAGDVVEVQSLIAYPDRRGNGSTVMQRLCGLADELGVTLWLDAHPFGRNRQHIPLR